MAWRCKKCGGKIYAIVTSIQSKTFTLGKSGTPERYLRKYNEETTGINYFYNECDSYWENGTKLEDIAEWLKTTNRRINNELNGKNRKL